MNDISIVTTCVNFGDYLEIIAPSWNFAKQVVVATKEGDHKTQQVCDKHGFRICVTDSFDHYGTNNKPAAFNKGRPLNEAIDMLNDPQWILITDSDMAYPQGTIELLLEDEFDRDTLYGIRRAMVRHSRFIVSTDPLEVRRKGYNLESLLYPHYRDNIPLGFFQLFWDQGQRHSETFGTAATVDVVFSKKWEQREFLPGYHAFHMGEPRTHWNGRVEDDFFSTNL